MQPFHSLTRAALAALTITISGGAFAQTTQSAPPMQPAQSMQPSMDQRTPHSDVLYQALGNKEGIRKIVDELLLIVQDDTRINESFLDADIERLAELLTEQFCDLSGGPCKYSGRDMQEAHADFKISVAHFNALAEDLQKAMDKQGVPSRTQNKLIAKLAPMQRTIVNK